MIRGRYSKANIKYMRKMFDASKPSNYISKLDAKIFSGNALSYPIPQSGFTWKTEEHWSTINWLAQREEQYFG